jgi:hypothetical protein
VALSRPIPRTGALGWSYVQLSVAVPAVRDIRIDFGDIDHLIELDHLTVVFNVDRQGAIETKWRIERVDDQRLSWPLGRVLSPSRVAIAQGGFLLANVSGTPLAESTRVDIRCAFRVNPLRGDDASVLLRSGMTDKALMHAKRAITAARTNARRR